MKQKSSIWPYVLETAPVELGMEMVRLICEKGHQLRKQAGIPLRQPLSTMYISDGFMEKVFRKSYNRVIKLYRLNLEEI